MKKKFLLKLKTYYIKIDNNQNNLYINNKILWLKECDKVNVTQSLANQTQKNLNSTQTQKLKKKDECHKRKSELHTNLKIRKGSTLATKS